MIRPAPALAAVAAAVVVGCGGGSDDGQAAPLAWESEPVLIRAPTAGADRVLVGKIHNNSPEFVELVAERTRVRDADGERLRSDARYVSTYVHGLYGADVPIDELPDSERLRLGLTAVIPPNGTAPVYAAFRDRDSQLPLTLDTGEGSLPIPTQLNRPGGERRAGG